MGGWNLYVVVKGHETAKKKKGHYALKINEAFWDVHIFLQAARTHTDSECWYDTLSPWQDNADTGFMDPQPSPPTHQWKPFGNEMSSA